MIIIGSFHANFDNRGYIIYGSFVYGFETSFLPTNIVRKEYIWDSFKIGNPIKHYIQQEFGQIVGDVQNLL